MKLLKVLNLYVGIGGNRKLWQNVEVTAVEQNAEIAKIYSDFFPDDKVIVGDAHQFLLEHFAEYDFIWASPPCPTHSKYRFLNDKKVYPDMKLWQEIIFLQHFAKGLWVIENVQPYYEPFLTGIALGRHYYWSNFRIQLYGAKIKGNPIKYWDIKDFENHYNYNLDKYNFGGYEKRQILRNCVDPQLGLHVLNCALGTIPPMPMGTLFENENEQKYA
jgi:DNA (cytosine-5)-methyltransferase 1